MDFHRMPDDSGSATLQNEMANPEAREQNAPFNGPNTDARDQSSPDCHIRLAPHGRPIHKHMVKRRGPPSQTWRTFLRNHAPDIAAIDLFVVPTLSLGLLHGLVIIRIVRRNLVWVNLTTNPTAEWVARQLTEAFPWDRAPRHLIRDRDGVYGGVFRKRLSAMGIRDHPIAPRSPWQNAYAERRGSRRAPRCRFIGSAARAASPRPISVM